MSKTIEDVKSAFDDAWIESGGRGHKTLHDLSYAAIDEVVQLVVPIAKAAIIAKCKYCDLEDCLQTLKDGGEVINCSVFPLLERMRDLGMEVEA